MSMVLQVHNDSTLFLGGFKTRWSRFKHWCLKWNFIFIPFSIVADVSDKKVTITPSILKALWTIWKNAESSLPAYIGVCLRGKDNKYYYLDPDELASTDFGTEETNELGQLVECLDSAIEMGDSGTFGGFIANDTVVVDLLYSAQKFVFAANEDPTVYPQIVSDIPVVSASFEATWQS